MNAAIDIGICFVELLLGMLTALVLATVFAAISGERIARSMSRTGDVADCLDQPQSFSTFDSAALEEPEY